MKKLLDLDFHIRWFERLVRMRMVLMVLGMIAPVVLLLSAISFITLEQYRAAVAMFVGGCSSYCFVLWIVTDEYKKIIDFLRKRRHLNRFGYLPYDPVI